MKGFFKSRVPALVICVCLLPFLVPAVASAGVGDIISLLKAITTTLQNDVGQALSGIESTKTAARDFEQQVVWPTALINQTKASIRQVESQFGGSAKQIHNLTNNSAILPNSSQLEVLLRGQQSADASQIAASYARIYQGVPGANDAAAGDRNLMDIDDAVAVGTLKAAVISDQTGEQMLNIADGLQQQAVSSSPGSAPLITVQAQAASLHSQAMLQRMLAAELRQEATRLAHANILRKRQAEAARALRNHMQQILSR